jgi:membrane-associated protein
MAVLDTLIDTLSGSPWLYALILGFAALDVLVPLVPSEATVILGGVLAGGGDLHIAGVIAAGAAGAIIGDNISYGLGRVFGSRLVARFARGEKAQRRVAWAEQQITVRGGALIVTSRFIPGGRTAATLSAGTLEMPWRRFISFDLLAGVVWAGFAGLLGYFGGQAFRDDPGTALLIALGVTLGLAAVVEVIRSWRVRHKLAVVPPADLAP